MKGHASTRRLVLLVAALAGASALTSSAAPVAAQVIQGQNDRYRSPQHFAVELRFGPYKPDIDSEFDGARTPYEDFFGSSRRLMTQIEFDYQIIRHVGSLGVGLGVGYFSESGRNRVSDTGVLSEDTTNLKLFPFALSAIYRFDLAYERWGIPLVPYGKIGLDYVIWSMSNGNGETPSFAGGTARGGTWGWHSAVGLSLVLDFLDPVSAHQFDIESGINHTHLFVELGHWNVSSLGSANKLHVGDTTWMAGLLFEF